MKTKQKGDFIKIYRNYLKVYILSPILWVTIIFLSPTGCAFKLRSQNQLPPALHVLYLKTEQHYGEFESMLRNTLESTGILLIDSPQPAAITLHVFKPLETNTSVTIGSTNHSRVYTIRYSVVFELIDCGGKMILEPQQLTAVRTFTLSANQLLETNNQLPLLEQEMRRDLITQLYNRLNSEQVALIGI